MKKRIRTKTKTFTTSYYYYYSQNINYHEKKLYNYLNVREKKLIFILTYPLEICMVRNKQTEKEYC